MNGNMTPIRRPELINADGVLGSISRGISAARRSGVGSHVFVAFLVSPRCTPRRIRSFSLFIDLIVSPHYYAPHRELTWISKTCPRNDIVIYLFKSTACNIYKPNAVSIFAINKYAHTNMTQSLKKSKEGHF